MANKFQNIGFRNFNDFYDYLPKEEQEIVILLKSIILDTIPNCIENIAYNVPFYSRNSRICFIWPAAIPWGKIKSGVALGLCKGNLIQDSSNYFDLEGRKEVARHIFQSTEEIDISLVCSFLEEAIRLDDRIS